MHTPAPPPLRSSQPVSAFQDPRLDALRPLLVDAGFTPRKYDGQFGEFLAIDGKLKDLPYERETMAGTDGIDLDDMALIEVCATPGEPVKIQLSIPASDYAECFSLADVHGEDGFSLLREGVGITAANEQERRLRVERVNPVLADLLCREAPAAGIAINRKPG